MSEHFIERCVCGTVIAQCRCPGPKTERTRPGPCACKSSMPDDGARVLYNILTGNGLWLASIGTRKGSPVDDDDAVFVSKIKLRAFCRLVISVDEHEQEYHDLPDGVRAAMDVIRALGILPEPK